MQCFDAEWGLYENIVQGLNEAIAYETVENTARSANAAVSYEVSADEVKELDFVFKTE